MSDPTKAVFLSYAHEDAAAATRIAEALRGFGIEVWFDQNELRGGDQWDAKIRGQIKSCALFIPIISATTQSRDEAYFRREWKMADDRTHDMASGKAFIVPVVIDATPESGAAVPDSFSRAQWTRLIGGVPSTGFIEQVKRLLEGPAKTMEPGRPLPAERGEGAASPKKQSPGVPGWVWGGAAVVLAVGAYFWLGRSTPATPSASNLSSPASSLLPAASPAPARPSNEQTSIAVLAFANMSPDKDQEYFSDGISEEILNVLAKTGSMRVISRSSAFSFKGKNLDVPTIAKQLDVEHVLEGSVRKSGNKVRITAQLIKAGNDAHLWSETYDRELTDIFAVQDEIAAKIVAALKVHLVGSKPLTTRAAVAPEAYEAFLRGRHLVVQRTKASIEGAVAEYQRAIAIAPDYALAHAELAIAHGLLRREQYGDLSTEEAAARARPHAEKALALAPDLTEAHTAMGYYYRVIGRLDEQTRYFDRALELNPNDARVLSWLSLTYSVELGDFAKSFALVERALKLDPLSVSSNLNHLNDLLDRGRPMEAAAAREKLKLLGHAAYLQSGGDIAWDDSRWADAALLYLDGMKLGGSGLRARAFLTNSLSALGFPREAALWAPNPYFMIVVGDVFGALRRAGQDHVQNPHSRSVREHLAIALATNGEWERAAPLLEAVWHDRGGRIMLQRSDTLIASLAEARRLAGDTPGVKALAASVLGEVRRVRGEGLKRPDDDFLEGFALWFSGKDKAAGLALIRKAAERGHFIPPGLNIYQTLYDESGFAPILALQLEKQKVERAKFLAVLAQDRSYDEILQLTPETRALLNR